MRICMGQAKYKCAEKREATFARSVILSGVMLQSSEQSRTFAEWSIQGTQDAKQSKSASATSAQRDL